MGSYPLHIRVGADAVVARARCESRNARRLEPDRRPMIRAWRRWVLLLDTREPAHALAAMRIIAGATAFTTLAHAWTSGVAEVLWTSERSWPSLRTILVFALVATAMLTVGWFTRIAAVVAWISFRTIVFANAWSCCSGDAAVAHHIFLLC